MLNSSWQIFRFVFVLSLSVALVAQSALAQTAKQTPTTGKRYPRLVIRNAMIADGNGTPASGPKDIVIEGNMISEIVPLDPVALKAGRARRPAGDVEIDATGRYVLPGLINAHAHVQDERGGIPQPVDCELKMWLACGITAVRDVGSDTKKTLVLREQSLKGERAAPRLFVYPMFTALGPVRNTDQARARVR